jgi:hypothetical protein
VVELVSERAGLEAFALAGLEAAPLLLPPPQAAIANAAAIGIPSVISRIIRCLL